MAVTAKPLFTAKTAENTTTTQYTASNVTTIIDKFTVTNYTGTAAVFTVYLVPDGGAAAVSNVVLNQKSVAAYATYTCPELVGHVLENGGFISTIAGTASALSIRASGREIT